MALPVPQLTWQFNVNNSASGSSAQINAAIIYGIKAALTSFANSPWTVVSSSDGVVNVGAADYWLSAANIVQAAGNHSWVVLKQTGMAGGNAQVCIDCNSGVPCYISVLFSPNAGFIGGTLAARPAAADEVTAVSGNTYGGPNSATTTRWHVMQSADGRSTRIFICRTGMTTGMWEISDILNPNPSVWPFASCISLVGSPDPATEVAAYYNVMNFQYTFFRLPDGSSATGSLTTLCVLYGSDQQMGQRMLTPDGVTGEWQATPAGIYSATLGKEGYRGDRPDMWTTSNTVVSGSSFPADASRQFAAFGRIIVPWNGTVPAVA